MSTINVSLPESLKSFVDEQVASRGYGTGGGYVRELIRKDLERQTLRGLLRQGAKSAPGAVVERGYFAALRRRARRKTK